MKGSFLCLRWQHTLMDNHAKHTHTCWFPSAAGDSFHPGTCERRRSTSARWAQRQTSASPVLQQSLTRIWASAGSCRPWRRSRSPSARAPSAAHTPWPGPAPASTEAVWADSETLQRQKSHRRSFHHLSDFNVSDHQIWINKPSQKALLRWFWSLRDQESNPPWLLLQVILLDTLKQVFQCSFTLADRGVNTTYSRQRALESDDDHQSVLLLYHPKFI